MHTHTQKPYQTDLFQSHAPTAPFGALHKMKSFRVRAMQGLLLQPNIENVNFLASTDHL